MRFRKLKADRLFDGKRFLEGLVLVVSDDGTVADLAPENEAGSDIETFAGIITQRGHVNTPFHN